MIFRLPKRSEELAQELPFRTFLLSPNLVSQNVDECYRDITPNQHWRSPRQHIRT
jgi:hypothetical protein